MYEPFEHQKVTTDFINEPVALLHLIPAPVKHVLYWTQSWAAVHEPWFSPRYPSWKHRGQMTSRSSN